MDKPIVIKGIKKDNYPILYECTENVMKAYDMSTISVKVKEKGFNAYASSSIIRGDRIAVTKDLLKVMNKDELEAIIAHEFSHLFNRDVTLQAIIKLLFLSPLFILWLGYVVFHPTNVIVQAFIFLFMLLAYLIPIFGNKIINWITIDLEIRSDIDAVLKTKKPKALRSAFYKLEYHSLDYKTRPGVYKKFRQSLNYIKTYFMGYTHPPTKERIEYLEYATDILAYLDTNRQ
jgi:heat shock protein HtpX